MTLTQKAIDKAVEVMKQQNPEPKYLRIRIQGGGCSGFQYNMGFEKEILPLDKKFKFKSSDGSELTVLIDSASILYLKVCEVDYVETLEVSGFKFNNPNATSTCGCGSSFSA